MKWTRIPLPADPNQPPPVDTRIPVAWLTYPHPPTPDPLTPVGPTYSGAEMLWPVVVEGNRVGYSYIQPPVAGAA